MAYMICTGCGLCCSSSSCARRRYNSKTPQLFIGRLSISKGAAAGVDLVVMGEIGKPFEDAEQVLVPASLPDLDVAGAALRTERPKPRQLVRFRAAGVTVKPPDPLLRQTPHWRKGDSNRRSLPRTSPALRPERECRSRRKRQVSGTTVRSLLPPQLAESAGLTCNGRLCSGSCSANTAGLRLWSRPHGASRAITSPAAAKGTTAS
jgi:hypothetical protein